jgi:monoterpene epsilon-lactone hydrolase
VVATEDGAPYIVCTSSQPFVNPTTPSGATPEEINRQLNLHLGQSFITREKAWFAVKIIAFLDCLLIRWWEPLIFILLKLIPLSIRRALISKSWDVYFALHKRLLGRSTGLHPSQSLEYHALTTVLWWSRFVTPTVPRIRFSLSQLSACTRRYDNLADESPVHVIDQVIDMEHVPSQERGHCRVKGLFIRTVGDKSNTGNNGAASRPTIFWLYGGAFLAGDAAGNAAAAEHVGRQCNADVFIPDFRLAPEATMNNVLWDVCLAYQWLCRQVKNPSTDIVVLGVSSGAAVAVRLLQLIAEHARGEELLPDYLSVIIRDETVQMPSCAALLGPYVDYTEPKTGSFLHYPLHDLIVTEAVQEHGLPYLDDFIPDGRRREYSPVYRNMEGLPALCVIVSEHESVYDMTMLLVNQAREAGVSVQVGVWKYMCHVFSLLNLCPEGRASMELVCDWIKEQQQA